MQYFSIFHSRVLRRQACLTATATLLLVFVTGCKRESIQVYQVPKEKSAQAPVAEGPHWNTPKGWAPQPAGGMRVASFLITDTNGQRADVAVIPLTGHELEEVDMVNMWRGDVSQRPIDANGVAKAAEKVTAGGASGNLFDFVGTSKTNAQPRRVIAAMIPSEGTTWFFKMSGSPGLIEQNKAAFKDFLKTFDFGAAPLQPEMASAPVPASSNSKSVPADSAAPKFKAPPGWQEQPPSPMRIASFLVQGEGGAADVSVSALGGAAGGFLGNVNRWRGQVGLGEIDQAQLTREAATLDVAGSKAILVDITSANRQTNTLGVILPHGDRTWFYKMTGSAAVVKAQKNNFVEFVKSAQIP